MSATYSLPALDLAAGAVLERDLRPHRRHEVGLLLDDDRGGGELLVGPQLDRARGELRLQHDAPTAQVVRAQDPQPLRALSPVGQHHVVGERLDPLEALGRLLDPHRRPGAVVLVTVAGDRALRQPKLRRLVVGDHQQGLAAVREHAVLGVVLHAAPTATHRAGGGSGVLGIEHPHLAGVAVLREQHDQAAGARRADADLELLVRLLQHQHVLVGRCADPVAPHLVGAVGLVVHRVEEVRRVGAPRSAVVGPRHDVGQVLAALQVPPSELVDLVAGAVDRVGEQSFVRTDHCQAELQVARVVGQEVGVEQKLAPTGPAVSGLPRKVEITQQLRVLPSRREERVVVTTLMPPTD